VVKKPVLARLYPPISPIPAETLRPCPLRRAQCRQDRGVSCKLGPLLLAKGAGSRITWVPCCLT
jgi:hypothetical protein